MVDGREKTQSVITEAVKAHPTWDDVQLAKFVVKKLDDACIFYLTRREIQHLKRGGVKDGLERNVRNQLKLVMPGSTFQAPAMMTEAFRRKVRTRRKEVMAALRECFGANYAADNQGTRLPMEAFGRKNWLSRRAMLESQVTGLGADIAICNSAITLLDLTKKDSLADITDMDLEGAPVPVGA